MTQEVTLQDVMDELLDLRAMVEEFTTRLEEGQAEVVTKLDEINLPTGLGYSIERES